MNCLTMGNKIVAICRFNNKNQNKNLLFHVMQLTYHYLVKCVNNETKVNVVKPNNGILQNEYMISIMLMFCSEELGSRGHVELLRRITR